MKLTQRDTRQSSVTVAWQALKTGEKKGQITHLWANFSLQHIVLHLYGNSIMPFSLQNNRQTEIKLYHNFNRPQVSILVEKN